MPIDLLQSTSDDVELLQAIVDCGGPLAAARQHATDVTLVQSVLDRLQDCWHTRSVVDTIVFAYRSGQIH